MQVTMHNLQFSCTIEEMVTREHLLIFFYGLASDHAECECSHQSHQLRLVCPLSGTAHIHLR